MKIYPVATFADVENRLLSLGYRPREIAKRMHERTGVPTSTWRRWRSGQLDPSLPLWREVVDEVRSMTRAEVRHDRAKRAKRDGIRVVVRRRKGKIAKVGNP